MNDRTHHFAFFGATKARNTSPCLVGGTLTAIFGDIVLDLTSATLPPEGATLTALALFGDITIRVPRGWRVELGGVPLFGSNEDRTDGAGSGAHVLRVSCVTVLGEVQVKNGNAVAETAYCG